MNWRADSSRRHAVRGQRQPDIAAVACTSRKAISARLIDEFFLRTKRIRYFPGGGEGGDRWGKKPGRGSGGGGW